ncbi:hypothetical protein BACCELL_03851, partial [Bacteroides cellulosilyticus DSM 14838]
MAKVEEKNSPDGEYLFYSRYFVTFPLICNKEISHNLVLYSAE